MEKTEVIVWAWHNGDPSVGMEGGSFKFTVTLEGPLSDGYDAGDLHDFNKDFETAAKEMVGKLRDWLEPDFKLHVETQQDMADVEQLELNFEGGK